MERRGRELGVPMSARKRKGDAGEAAYAAFREVDGCVCYPLSPSFPSCDLLILKPDGGLELVEVKTCDTCCGFGGTFSVKYPVISTAMLDHKLAAVEAAGVDAIVSGDVSCLLQIGGRLARQGSRVRAMHLAEVLANRSRVEVAKP